MTMTVGAGPFGHRPTGRFGELPPARLEYLEPVSRRIRALIDERSLTQWSATEWAMQDWARP